MYSKSYSYLERLDERGKVDVLRTMIDHYWRILLKRWKLIVICFVVTGLAVYIFSKLMTPMYQSTAVVQVAVSSNNSQASIDALQASDQLVQTEAQLALSDPVLREVASHYPGLTVDQLAKNASTTVKANTQLFQIDVLDASPTSAQRPWPTTLPIR